MQRESEKTFLSVCRKCPEREWLTPVPLTPLSSTTENIGSANWEWEGEQLPWMEGGAPLDGSRSVSPGQGGGQPQSIRVSIHPASLSRGQSGPWEVR